MQSPHTVLGIPENADENTIKKAYKRLAIRYHPDRNKDENADEKFKEVVHAYQILTGKTKRPPNNSSSESTSQTAGSPRDNTRRTYSAAELRRREKFAKMMEAFMHDLNQSQSDPWHRSRVFVAIGVTVAFLVLWMIEPQNRPIQNSFWEIVFPFLINVSSLALIAYRNYLEPFEWPGKGGQWYSYPAVAYEWLGWFLLLIAFPLASGVVDAF